MIVTSIVLANVVLSAVFQTNDVASQLLVDYEQATVKLTETGIQEELNDKQRFRDVDDADADEDVETFSHFFFFTFVSKVFKKRVLSDRVVDFLL